MDDQWFATKASIALVCRISAWIVTKPPKGRPLPPPRSHQLPNLRAWGGFGDLI